LTITISGQSLSLTINKAIVTFKHQPGTKEIVDGTIAGVITTEELLTGVGAIAGRLDKGLCQGTTLESIKQALRQASDMMADGTHDPSADCNGISVGLGFTGKQVKNPTRTAPPAEPAPDPCTTPQDAGNPDAADGAG